MTDQTVITAIRDLVWASIEDRVDDRIKDIINDCVTDRVEEKFNEDINDRVEQEVANYFRDNSFSIEVN